MPAASKAFSDARARRVFLTVMLTGLRRSELRALGWGHVNLVEGALRVAESKSEEGERLIALPAALVDELMGHYRGSSYGPTRTRARHGAPTGSGGSCSRPLAAARITDRVRIHDLRPAALTNLAATGASPIAVMATAGHGSMQTTKQYVHLVVFHDDADALSRRLLGVSNSGTNTADAVQTSQTG